MASSGGWPASPPETFAAHCRGCTKPAIVEVIAEWDITPGGPEDVIDPHSWAVGRCQTCLSPSLWLAEWQEGQWSSNWGPRLPVWPETSRSLPSVVPKSLRDSYEEAQRCMAASSYTAAAMMARRVVEGICSHSEAEGKNLHQKLQDLHAKGVLDDRLHQWSSLVKDIGNEGAHEIDEMLSQEDAEEVLAFVEALLDYLYVFRVRYEEFIKRRERVKAGQSPLEPLDLSALSHSGERGGG